MSFKAHSAKAKHMKGILWTIAILAFLPFSGAAQSLEKVLEAGDKAFESRDYYTAFRCYETVLRYDDDKYSRPQRLLAYQYGLAAQRFNFFSRADSVFANLMVQSEDQQLKDSLYARTVFYRAQVQLAEAETDEDYQFARSLFQMLADGLAAEISADPLLQDRFQEAAEAGIRKCEYGLDQGGWVKKDTLYRYTNEQVNSPYSDLAPVMKGDSLFFSSLRFAPKPARQRKQSTTYSKNLLATTQPNDTMGVDTLVAELPVSERFNSSEHFTLHHAESKNGKWLVFSTCEAGTDSIRCDLYKRRKLEDGSWGSPVPLNVNQPAANTTQPALAYDCTTGGQWLYFASDREGSMGGMDIWRAPFDEETGTAGAVENLGEPVNTPWDEATPFFHSLSQMLYFSSDAPPGFGQYDLFSAVYQDGGWGKPQNLGAPYNTGFNDMYFFSTPDGRSFMLSSDRPRSVRFDEQIEACCQDIYAGQRSIARSLEIELVQCVERPAGYRPSLLNVTDVSDCQAPVSLLDTTALGDLQLGFEVERFRKYRVQAINESLGLSIDTLIDLNAPMYDTLEVASLVLELLPEFIELEVSSGFVFKGQLLEVGVPVVADAKGAAVQPYAGDKVFRLARGTQYNIEIQVDSALSEIAGVAADPVKLYPATLQGVRFPREACRQVCRSEVDIPLKAERRKQVLVYFHNDKPNRAGRVAGGFRGYTSVTDQKLEDAVEDYFALKPEYLARTLDPDDATGVERLFENEIKGSLSGLDDVAADLMGTALKLGPGQAISVEIQGYCSGHGASVYNDSLAVRRIQCIREYLEAQEVNGERLGDYMGQPGSGKPIQITPKPVGESTASSNYSGARDGRYSIGALLDRRVELLVVLPEQDAPTLSVFDIGDDCTQNNSAKPKNPEQ